MAENAELINGLMEAFNRRDFEYIRERTGPDSVLTDVGSGETWRGPDEGQRYTTMWAEAFPDGKITVDRIIEAGDTVVVEYTGNGTHTGDMVTSRGTIPATGKKVTLHFCDIYDLKDGKVLSQRTYGDSGALMAQLGLTTAQPTAAQ
jgi:steroid delta-isomerase-like uncharacterized protein